MQRFTKRTKRTKCAWATWGFCIRTAWPDSASAANSARHSATRSASICAPASKARGDGGALVYRLKMPEGTLLYQDTCSYWPGILPALQSDVAILAAAGRGNLAGEPVQGSLAQFVAQEVGQLRPRRVILGHHDDWLPGVSTAVDTAPIRAAIAEKCPTAELAEMGYCAAFEVFAKAV